jgi:hypothetical protein
MMTKRQGCGSVFIWYRSESRFPDPGFWWLKNFANKCCGFRMFIPNPGLKNSNKREGWKNFVVISLIVAKNLTNLKLFNFWTGKEINLGKILDYRFTDPDLQIQINTETNKKTNVNLQPYKKEKPALYKFYDFTMGTY